MATNKDNKTINLGHGVGRRKTSVARVYLRDGNGQVKVNGKKLEEYFVDAINAAICPIAIGPTGPLNKIETTNLQIQTKSVKRRLQTSISHRLYCQTRQLSLYPNQTVNRIPFRPIFVVLYLVFYFASFVGVKLYVPAHRTATSTSCPTKSQARRKTLLPRSKIP